MIKNSCYISNRNIIIILNVTTENDFVNVLWLLLCNMCRLIKGSLIIFKMDNDDTCKESIVRLNIGQCPLIISTITCTIIIIPISFSLSLSLSLSLIYNGLSTIGNGEKHCISTFSIFEHLNIPKRIIMTITTCTRRSHLVSTICCPCVCEWK